VNLDTQGQPPILLLNHPALSSSPQNVEYGIDDYGGDTEDRFVRGVQCLTTRLRRSCS
jgi:hypothetical protein